MEFELTDARIKPIFLLHFSKQYGEEAAKQLLDQLPDCNYAKTIAHEAQKELVKWLLGEMIKVTWHKTIQEFLADCIVPAYVQALLKHFELGVNDETRRQRKSRKTSR